MLKKPLTHVQSSWLENSRLTIWEKCFKISSLQTANNLKAKLAGIFLVLSSTKFACFFSVNQKSRMATTAAKQLKRVRHNFFLTSIIQIEVRLYIYDHSLTTRGSSRVQAYAIL